MLLERLTQLTCESLLWLHAQGNDLDLQLQADSSLLCSSEPLRSMAYMRHNLSLRLLHAGIDALPGGVCLVVAQKWAMTAQRSQSNTRGR